jgi:hypothetical protein
MAGICDRNASYRAKKVASTSPGLRHLGSARRGLSPKSQALARAYKTFACRTSSGNIAARGSCTRRLRAHSAVCLIKTSKSGKREPSRPPIDAVAINSPPYQKRGGVLRNCSQVPSRGAENLVPAPTGISSAATAEQKHVEKNDEYGFHLRFSSERASRLFPGRATLLPLEFTILRKIKLPVCIVRYIRRFF